MQLLMLFMPMTVVFVTTTYSNTNSEKWRLAGTQVQKHKFVSTGVNIRDIDIRKRFPSRGAETICRNLQGICGPASRSHSKV